MKSLLQTISLTFVVVLSGCSLLQPTTNQNEGSYNEDLSVHRLKFEDETDGSQSTENNNSTMVEVTPSHDDTEALESKLKKIADTNKSETRVPGYTIQVYSGSSRDAASKAKAKVYQILPDARPVTRYDQPVYKVKVGQFADRLEAQGVYAKLREIFPSALVIPERIKVDG
ncbi:MAG: SPOR domain-containing protein [Cyclobacteriaceae bacterium]